MHGPWRNLKVIPLNLEWQALASTLLPPAHAHVYTHSSHEFYRRQQNPETQGGHYWLQSPSTTLLKSFSKETLWASLFQASLCTSVCTLPAHTSCLLLVPHSKITRRKPPSQPPWVYGWWNPYHSYFLASQDVGRENLVIYQRGSPGVTGGDFGGSVHTA